MSYWDEIFVPRAQSYWNSLDVGGSIESGIERGFQFVESLAGGLIDLVQGKNSDGWYSSAEDYVTPEHGPAAQPIININAAEINQQVGAVKQAEAPEVDMPQAEQAQLQEASLQEASVPDWAAVASHYAVPDEGQQAAQEQAFYAARQEEELTRGYGPSMR